MIDAKSPAGSWRREILSGPATTTQLREVISDLEHLLKVSRRDFEAMREANIDLVKRLAEAVAREMEQRAKVSKLENELGGPFSPVAPTLRQSTKASGASGVVLSPDTFTRWTNDR